MGTIKILGKILKGISSIKINNGTIVVDNNSFNFDEKVINIEVIEGTINNIQSKFSINITGDVGKHVDAGGSVKCNNVGGNVDAGGSVTCGHIYGYADAGGSIRCTSIKGNVDADGSVKYKDTPNTYRNVNYDSYHSEKF